MATYLVVAETADGGPAEYARELIAAARSVDSDVHVAVALIGSGLPDDSDLPADDVYLLDDESLANGDPGVFEAPVDALESLCATVNPDAVLLAKSDFGSITGPRLAYRLGSAAASDSTDIELDGDTGRLLVTRPVHGGNAVAKFRFAEGAVQVVVLRQGAYEPDTGTGSPAVERFDVSDAIKPKRAKLMRTVAQETEGVKLEDAEVVVSGGRQVSLFR